MQKWKCTISEKHFYQLFELLEKQTWLLKKTDAFRDLWFACNSDKEKELCIDLLNRFLLITNEKCKKLINKIYRQILFVWKLNPQQVIFLPIADKETLDGSIWILSILKSNAPKGFTSKNYLNHLTKCNDENICSKDKYLIVIDDFIGTGRKLTNKLKYVKKNTNVSRIYCVTPIGMLEGKNKLKENFPDIEFFIPQEMKKSITDYYTEEIELQKNNLKNITINFGLESKKLEKKYLGFGKSESLVAYVDHNISNNVFPIFWGRRKNNLETFFERNK